MPHYPRDLAHVLSFFLVSVQDKSERTFVRLFVCNEVRIRRSERVIERVFAGARAGGFDHDRGSDNSVK